jgi:hypothetical protein
MHDRILLSAYDVLARGGHSAWRQWVSRVNSSSTSATASQAIIMEKPV